jgi:4-diphosphocytidyl-2-C-methyl-D-erythritol kinase
MPHDPFLSRTRTSCVLACPAKVNLFLELNHKRLDGYHDLSTLIVPVNLYDTLELTLADSLTLRCHPDTVPSDERNFVWKAAVAMQKKFNTAQGVSIHLTKRIPHEAGLGGGSSDAAMTLLGLNELWKLNASLEMLAEVAATLGSDMAAFLYGPSWCTGRGEIIEPAPAKVQLHLVIIKPPVGCSTAEVYRRVKLDTQPMSDAAMRATWNRGDVTGICNSLHNRLESPAFDLQPTVKRLYDAMLATQPLGRMLSGSGSCVFAVARDADHQADMAKQLEHESRHGELRGGRVFAVTTLA